MTKNISGQIHSILQGIVILLFLGGVTPANAVESGIDATQLPLHRFDSGQRQGPRRKPPTVAIEACVGKNEGEPCSFTAKEGVRSGECLAGLENVFACRPHRGETAIPKGEPQAPQPQVQAPAPKNVSEPEPPPSLPSQQQNEHSTVHDTTVPPQASIGESGSAAAPIKEAQSPLPSGNPGGIAGFNSREFGSYLLAALLSTGLAWIGFYRYSILPLRRLRVVTQQLAAGDLSARVGEGLVPKKNEVADLGRDVDRMAERIERLVGAHQRLVRDVSHELRSPLARLNVALELARHSAGPAHSAPFDRIERESDRLNELIGQLLMLTKLESEGAMNQLQEIKLAELIIEIAQDSDFEAKGNDRRVLATAEEQLHLTGNRELIRQAIENLVRNAVKYTAPGTAVDISLRKRESGGRRWAHIEVRDQGPGVPESELFDIFRPFYRVSDARERKSGGTGVGLAISDRAVRLHGGSLRAFNAPSGGLVMEMELPLA